MRSEDSSMEKQVKAITVAVHKLTVAQQERTALCFSDYSAMRHMPGADKYLQAVPRKMMQSAELAAATAPAPTPEPPNVSAVDAIHVVKVDDGVTDMDVTPLAADASSSAPAAGASAGANAPPGEDPPVAPVAARTAGATAMAAEAASPAAPPARGNGGGENQRGRQSQAAKQRASSAALNKQLDATRGLDDSSESDTTTTTTEDTE